MSDGAGRYPPTMRASDADRDVVLAELGEHFQAGRLTSDELEERTGQALQARTFGDLARLTADLPQAASTRPPAGQAAGAVSRPGGHRPPMVAPIVLGLATVAVVAAAFLDTGPGTRGVHVLWLILVIPLVARMLARRRR
jgi:Domain of unknown function (DUF1707)